MIGKSKWRPAMAAKTTTRTLKPNSNPHPRGTDLARGYAEGWRDAHLQSEAMLDQLTESLAGAQLHLERDADPKSRRRAVIDIDTLVRRDLERERARGRRAA
jgi:hypothetical protein